MLNAYNWSASACKHRKLNVPTLFNRKPIKLLTEFTGLFNHAGFFRLAVKTLHGELHDFAHLVSRLRGVGQHEGVVFGQ